MRQVGEITRWDDGRGFGFISPTGGGQQVFVHVSSLPRGTRPAAGDVVTFLVTHDDRDRPRASEVEFATSSHHRPQPARGVRVAGAVGAVWFVLLGALAVLGLLPALVVALSALSSVAAFVLYRKDKAAAIRGAWRVPESTLQVVSLLGGWPGALLAQRVYRHKTRKQPFQTVFRVIVVVNCVVMAWIAIGQPI